MRFLTTLGLLIAIGATSAPAAQLWVFVSISKENEVAVFSLDPATGSLTKQSSTSVAGSGPGAMCANKDSTRLYVALKNAEKIAAYQISENGSLVALNEVSVGAAPSYLALHPSGQYLLSSYYNAGKVAVHRIEQDGRLSSPATYELATDEKAHAVILDSTGKYLFVPHTGPNSIFQFVFDQRNGTLLPNTVAKLQREANTGPRHLWFHPNGKFVFGSDEQGSSVTAYAFDDSTGQLGAIETKSTLPDSGFTGKNSTSDIELHPSGKFVYVANRGYDTIASFSVDGDSGRLTPLQHTPTETVTRSFNISPNGQFLIAAGQRSNRLAVYRIGSDGILDPIGQYPVGLSPWWVQIIER